MPRFAPMACIAGYGRTRLGKLRMSATTLMQQALESALSRASLRLRDLDGLVVVLSEGSVSRWPSWPAMPCLADIL